MLNLICSYSAEDFCVLLFLRLDNFSCLIIKSAILFSCLLGSAVQPLLWIFYYNYCTSQLQSLVSFHNFYFFIGVLILSTHCFLIAFSSLSMVSFSTLSIFRTVDLSSSTNNSSVWTSSGMVSVKFFFFFFLWMGHTFMFFCILYNFLLRATLSW